jgi:hypothetical protein
MDSLWTSLLVTFAPLVVWLVAVFFSYKQYKEMQKQTEALQKQVEELQKKPELDVRLDYTDFDPTFPDNRLPTKDEIQATFEETINVRHIKLIVCNKGKATAKECSAKVEIIEKEPPNRVISSMFLTWDLSNRNFIDIPVNDCEMANLITITREYEAGKLMYDSLSVGMITFYNISYITNQEDWIYGKNKMLKIAVYCENATSELVYLTIKQSPKVHEIINSKNISEFFEEKR